jgi:hypothetical protein
MKKCVKCGALLPESKFNKHKAAKDGLQSWCRDCQKNYDENIHKKLDRIISLLENINQSPL